MPGNAPGARKNMKKVFLFALMLLALSCGKKGLDLKPTALWESNPNFAEMEILEDMEAKVDFSVPEGVASFNVTVDIPAEFLIPVNQMIGISGNKGTSAKKPVLDLVGDTQAVQTLRSIGFMGAAGTSLKDAKNVTLDFARLVFALIGDHANLLQNATKFNFTVALKDNEANVLSSQVRFNWTSVPEITLTSGIIPFKLAKGTTEKLVLKLSANGKIDGVQLYFLDMEGSADEGGILAWIKKRNNGSAVIDLIETDASKAFNLPAPSYFKGKTSVDLDLTRLMTDFSYEATPGASMLYCVKVTDQLGRPTEYSFLLNVPAGS